MRKRPSSPRFLYSLSIWLVTCPGHITCHMSHVQVTCPGHMSRSHVQVTWSTSHVASHVQVTWSTSHVASHAQVTFLRVYMSQSTCACAFVCVLYKECLPRPHLASGLQLQLGPIISGSGVAKATPPFCVV